MLQHKAIKVSQSATVAADSPTDMSMLKDIRRCIKGCAYKRDHDEEWHDDWEWYFKSCCDQCELSCTNNCKEIIAEKLQGEVSVPECVQYLSAKICNVTRHLTYRRR